MSKTLAFFGSGPVAAESLKHLLLNFKIECVITKHRPQHHKDPAPVEDLARLHNLNILFADNTNELEQMIITNQVNSSLGLIIDFGVIISQAVINNFSDGIINSHFSLLPHWRGADPITFALLSGQNETGVCLMVIDYRLDFGDLIACQKCPIFIDENNQKLTSKLVDISNRLLDQYLPEIFTGNFRPITQPDIPITYSKKLVKSDGRIDWSKPSEVIAREIRAYSEWPGSYCKLGDIDVIITKAISVIGIDLRVGQISVTDQKTLQIGCMVGAFEVLELKPLGKKVMPVASFINGYKNRLLL